MICEHTYSRGPRLKRTYCTRQAVAKGQPLDSSSEVAHYCEGHEHLLRPDTKEVIDG